MNPKWRVAGECREVRVGVEQFGVGPDGHGSDQTVDDLSDGLTSSSTSPVESCCLVVVGRCRREHHRSAEKTSQLIEMVFVSGASEHLHGNGVADGELSIEQTIEGDAHR